jgi:hypothetical protein
MLHGQTSAFQTKFDIATINLHLNLIIKIKCQPFMSSPQANFVKIMILIHSKCDSHIVSGMVQVCKIKHRSHSLPHKPLLDLLLVKVEIVVGVSLPHKCLL